MGLMCKNSGSGGAAVSVIIPIFNAERYLRQAVLSALRESECLEVILVEDGSSDESLRVCQGLVAAHPEKVHLVTHIGGKNLGAGASRNLGLSLARGEFIAFLDADDEELPGRFRPGVRLLQESMDLDGVYEAVSQMPATYEGDDPFDEGRRIQLLTMPQGVAPEDVLETILMPLPGNIHINGLLVRRKTLIELGGFSEHLRLGQDMDLIWRLAASCRLQGLRLDQPVATYRMHGANRAVPNNPGYAESPFAVALSVFQWSKGRSLSTKNRRLLRRVLFHHIGYWRGAPISWWRLRAIQVRRWLAVARVCPQVFVEPKIWLQGFSTKKAPVVKG